MAFQMTSRLAVRVIDAGIELHAVAFLKLTFFKPVTLCNAWAGIRLAVETTDWAVMTRKLAVAFRVYERVVVCIGFELSVCAPKTFGAIVIAFTIGAFV